MKNSIAELSLLTVEHQTAGNSAEMNRKIQLFGRIFEQMQNQNFSLFRNSAEKLISFRRKIRAAAELSFQDGMTVFQNIRSFAVKPHRLPDRFLLKIGIAIRIAGKTHASEEASRKQITRAFR